MYHKLFLTALFLILIGVKQTHAQSPTAAAHRFNIFVKGDATLQSSETEGPIAVGGNVITNQYQISFNPQFGAFISGNASIGLAVRGSVKLNSGTLTINNNNYIKIGQCIAPNASTTNLKTWYKDNNGAASTIRITETGKQYGDAPNILLNAQATSWTPSVSETENPVCENVFGTGANQIDIDGAFVTMIQKSDELSRLKDNLPIRDQNGHIMSNAPMGPYLDPSVIGNNPKIIVDPAKMNVLTVSAAVWNAIGNSNIEGIPAGASMGQTNYNGNFGLVINIINFPDFEASHGNKVKFPSVGGLSDSQGSYVIYNFVDATETLTLGGSTPIHGTIFAPQANLVKENSGDINGQIIAKSFVHKSDEVHFWPFLPVIPTTPLPVTLAGFTAKNENCDVNLRWTITEAKNFSHFVVERSTDAKSYISLGQVNYVAGNNEYDYSDSPYSAETLPVKNYYYRLKQVDNDDSFEYSAIRSVESETCDARLSIEFYPNPTQSEVNVKSFSAIKMLEIFDANGKKVYQDFPTPNQTQLHVNIQALAQGMYIVKILNGEGKHSSKILKK